MTITGFTHSIKADGPVQRFEVFTGAGRRCDWSAEEKAQIVAESYDGEALVSAVARRHGLSPGQLFTWRRQARRRMEQDAKPMFVPAVVGLPAEKLGHPRRTQSRHSASITAIELEIGGAIVRIASGADAATIAAVLQAVKAQS